MNPAVPKNIEALSESDIPFRTTRSFPEVETQTQSNIPLYTPANRRTPKLETSTARCNSGGERLLSGDGLSSQDNIDTIMRDIEKKTEQKLQNILAPVATASTGQKMEFIASQGHDLGDKLIGIMSSGADEFKAKTGRDMTYSEMRQLYG